LNRSGPRGARVRPAGRPLSVGYVCPSWPPEFDPNGIVKYIGAIGEGLRARGHSTTVLAQRLAGTPNTEGLYDLSRYRTSPMLPGRILDRLEYRANPGRAVDRMIRRSILAATRRAIAERGVQLLEIEESFGWSLGLGRALSIPLVVRLHCPWFLNGTVENVDRDDAFWSRVLKEGEAIRRAEWVSAPSQAVLGRTREYYNLPLERAEVIPNPTPRIVGAPWRLEDCAPQSVLFVGRFDRIKGGDLVIAAFARLADRFPAASLKFVGPDTGVLDDDRRPRKILDYLRERIPDTSVRNRIEWLGPLPHPTVLDLRRKALISVVSSRYDNFPTTVIEAMSLGCPIVATRTGGIPEQLMHEANGLLSEPGDAGDLADKIGRLLGDPALAARLGNQARLDWETRFSPEAVSAKMSAFYGGICA
jgi:glycosyltransferase involved in cell wall biosynthesis